MPKIKLTPKTESATDYSRPVTRELIALGDKVGGFTADEVHRLLNDAKIQLFILSKPVSGAPAMLPVISADPDDAWANDEYDPSGESYGNILVTKEKIEPWPVNWLSVDDNALVYINQSDFPAAIRALGGFFD